MPRQPKHNFRFTMYTPTMKTEYAGSVYDGIQQAFYGVQNAQRRAELIKALQDQDTDMTTREAERNA